MTMIACNIHMRINLNIRDTQRRLEEQPRIHQFTNIEIMRELTHYHFIYIHIYIYVYASIFDEHTRSNNLT